MSGSKVRGKKRFRPTSEAAVQFISARKILQNHRGGKKLAAYEIQTIKSGLLSNHRGIHSLILAFINKDKNQKKDWRWTGLNIEAARKGEIRFLEQALDTALERSSTGNETKKHIQIKLYEHIISEPEYFAKQTEVAINSRIESIQSALPNFSAEVRKAAEFNLRFFEMLQLEESREPIRLIDESGYFKWPQTGEWKSLIASENFYTGAESEGILGKIGYSVRADGPTERSRRTLLSRFFEGAISIPQGLPEEYVRDWGIPLSSQRLKKMAYSIAWFIRQRKSYERPHYGAIESYARIWCLSI